MSEIWTVTPHLFAFGRGCSALASSLESRPRVSLNRSVVNRPAVWGLEFWGLSRSDLTMSRSELIGLMGRADAVDGWLVGRFALTLPCRAVYGVYGVYGLHDASSLSRQSRLSTSLDVSLKTAEQPTRRHAVTRALYFLPSFSLLSFAVRFALSHLSLHASAHLLLFLLFLFLFLLYLSVSGSGSIP